MKKNNNLIPPHGGYRNLISYQKAEIVYDGTIYFCNRFFHKYNRTVDQMTQAARSGKQNIVEASMASGTSKGTEIRLTNVARASLEELLIDYEDFMRTNKIEKWERSHRLSKRFDELNKIPNANYNTFRKAIENKDPAICANIMWCLTNVTSYLLNRQLKTLEKDFLKEGGFRERMFKFRKNKRDNK